MLRVVCRPLTSRTSSPLSVHLGWDHEYPALLFSKLDPLVAVIGGVKGIEQIFLQPVISAAQSRARAVRTPFNSMSTEASSFSTNTPDPAELQQLECHAVRDITDSLEILRRHYCIGDQESALSSKFFSEFILYPTTSTESIEAKPDLEEFP